MGRNRGKRYDLSERKLNIKKVIATIIAIAVIIMIIISFKNLFTKETGKKEFSTLKTYIPVFENNKWGIIDNMGNVVIPLNYDEMLIVPDKSKGLFISTYNIDYNNETYKTKVINENGIEILTEFNNIEPIENTDSENVWYEKNVLKYESNFKYGLIDFDGKTILEPIYDKVYAMPGIEKYIIIEKDGKKGLVNSNTGEIIIDAEYTEISTLTKTNENGFIVKDINNKYGIIALDKTKILDFVYDEIKNVYGNKYYVVVKNGIQEIISQDEKTVLNSGFDSVEEIQLDNFIITQNGKYGVIDINGNTVIPVEFEKLSFSISEFFIAKKDGKYGIIHNDGTVVIDYKYENINYIKEADFFEAENQDYTTDLIDRNFNVVIEKAIVSELNTEIGYLRIRKDSEYKYYNFKFQEKTNIEILSTNTLFLIKENGKYGYINKNGEKVVDCIYDDAKEQNEYGFCAVKKDGLWGALNPNGSIALNPSKNLDSFLYIDFISNWYRYDDFKVNAYTK